jgi:hypothetical protein
MAIYFNDKILTPKATADGGNEIENRYWEEQQKLKEQFKARKGEISIVRPHEKQWDTTGTSWKPPVPYALPVEIPLYIDSIGAVSVRYSEYPPQRQGKNLTWPVTKLFVEDRITLRENQLDKAWYLLYATKFVRNEGNGKAFMWIDDPNEAIKVQAGSVKRMAQVDMYLTNESSALYNELAIRTIADKYGIDIKDHDLEIAAYVVRDAIVKGDEKKNPDVNIDNFLAFAKTLELKLKKKDPKKEETDIQLPEEITVEWLNGLEQKELNAVSKKLGTKTPPQVNRLDQTAQIMELQTA